MMYLHLTVLLLAALARVSEQARQPTFNIRGNIVGVGTDSWLFLRRSTNGGFSWIRIPNSCCVGQIHVLRNGYILGVAGRHLYLKRNLFSHWQLLPNSCCIKDITTFRDGRGRRFFVGIGMHGRLWSKGSLYGRWNGPHRHSGTVKAVAGVTRQIYGVGMGNHIWRRSGLDGRWHRISGSCCVKDISVQSGNRHFTYAVGMDNKLYATVLQNVNHVRWTFQGHHTCCVKAASARPLNVNVKVIGIGQNKQLYLKPNFNAGWAHVLGSGAVTHVTVLKNGNLIGVGLDHKLYVRSTIDDSSWQQVPHSCCVKSLAQLNDGRLIGVGMDNHLYTRLSIFGRWRARISNSGSITRVAVNRRNGQIIGIGMDKKLYYRPNLCSGWRGPLSNSGLTIDIAFGSDGYLYGIGLSKRIWKKTSRNVASRWRLIRHTCCIIGLTIA